MDSDILFGAAVWGGNEPPSTSTLPTTSSAADFDDFEEAAPNNNTFADDDEFGDFGDFEEGETSGFQEVAPAPLATNSALLLDAGNMPPYEGLEEQVLEILDPIWAHDDISSATTNEGIRDVEGISQILASRESRDLFNSLIAPRPATRPPNWIKSRIRRQHLIALGIPVNLDEVASSKALPTLHISTRPMSAPPGPRSTSRSRNGTGSVVPSRSGTPHPPDKPSLGERPTLDYTKISKLVDVPPEDLALLPVSALEKHAADLREQTANASLLLTHLLQSRDLLQQDSETYNKLIAELVGEAQKSRTSKGRTPVRKGSAMV